MTLRWELRAPGSAGGGADPGDQGLEEGPNLNEVRKTRMHHSKGTDVDAEDQGVDGAKP